MKKRALSILLALTMVFSHTAVLYAQDDAPAAVEEQSDAAVEEQGESAAAESTAPEKQAAGGVKDAADENVNEGAPAAEGGTSREGTPGQNIPGQETPGQEFPGDENVDEKLPDQENADGELTDQETVDGQAEEPAALELPVLEPQTQTYTPGGSADPDDLFAAYFENAMKGGKSGRKLMRKSASSRLSGLNLLLYGKIMEQIPLIASGDRASTVIEIPVGDVYGQTEWTAEDLGVELLFEDGQITDEAYDALIEMVSYDLSLLLDVMLAENPYQLYWFDKTSGSLTASPGVGGGYYDDGTQYLSLVGNFSFSFPVAAAYAAGEFEVDTEIGKGVQSTVTAAHGIVDQYAGYSDYDKLVAYKNRICDLVNYNHPAVDENWDYGDPWQVIWVFDGDISTDVVCEGYSKAFKYLCDLSSFSSDIDVILVTGMMGGGTGAGGHMWNLVSMPDGMNYVVDVTNCDDGSIGAPDLLFLAGTNQKLTEGEEEVGYVFTVSGTDITYTYDRGDATGSDTDMFALYGASALKISENDYDPNGSPIVPEHDLYETPAKAPDCTNDGNIAYWTCADCGLIFRDANGTEEIILEEALIAALGHALVHEEGLTVDGDTEYWQCERCGRIFSDEDGVHETELAGIILAEELIPSIPSDLNVDEVAPILLTVLPADTTDKSLQIDYSDPEVAEIYQEEDGYYIRGLKPGTTDIYISTVDGSDLYEECTVTVHGETSEWLSDYYYDVDIYDNGIFLYYYTGDEDRRDLVIYGSAMAEGVLYERIHITPDMFNGDVRSLTFKPGVLLPYNSRELFSPLKELKTLDMSGIDVTDVQDMSQMFEGCTSLQTIDFSGWNTADLVKIDSMFKSCSSIEELDLSSFDLSSLGGINENVFAGMDALRVIQAPLHLNKEIALPAVFRTPGGEMVTALPLELSESITLTYDHPLDEGETTVQNAKWKVTGSGAKRTLTFYGNGSLKWINNQSQPWSSNRKNIIKIVFENGVTDMGDLKLGSLPNLQTVVIGTGIKRIPSYAFESCQKLKNVSLPAGLIEIGDSAFGDCTALQTITLPDGIEMIGEFAFAYCTSLKSINFPESLEVMSEGAFITCTQLRSVVIPKKIHKISDYLFWFCENMQSVTFHENVTHIGPGAFGYNYALRSIDFPSSLYEIGGYAFSNCKGIEGYTLPESVRKIGENAFEGRSTGYLVIPSGVEEIAGDLFDIGYRAHIYYGGSEQQFRQLFSRIIDYNGGWEEFSSLYRIHCDVAEIIPAQEMTVELPELVAFDTNSEAIPASVLPADATCTEITVTSSNEDVLEPYQQDGEWHLYGFDDGWARITASVQDGSGLSYSQIVRVSGNPAYAKNKFTVVFNANGGSGSMKSLTGIPYKTGKALTANAFTRKGYKFVGWNTSKDGSGLAIANKGVAKELTRTNNGKITLYAQWEIIDYKLTYNLNGGTNSEENPATYTVLDAVTLQKPVRENYVFSGWYSDAKFKTKVTAIKKGTTGNKTYYAKWTPNKYKITFVKNGATGGKMADMTGIAFNAEKALTANAYTRKGYRFVGWSTVPAPTEEEPGTAYANKAKVKGLSYTNGDVIKLYAQWEIIDYKITYNLNGGTNNEANPATYQVITDTITLQRPTRTGYTFNGWYSDKKFKTRVTTIKKGSIGNRTLYAKWTANKYTVIFNKNDDAYPGTPVTTGTMKSQTLTYNSSTKLTANAFKKNGYTMTGWNTVPAPTEEEPGTDYANAMAKANVSSDPGARVTLYAQWAPTAYKINYNLPATAVNHALNPATYTIEDDTFELQAPTRPGYDFVGWYADAKLTKPANLTIETGSTGAKTFYPKWTAHTYTVVFDKNEAFCPESPIEGSMEEQDLTYDSTVKLAASTFKTDHYSVASWNTEPDGSGESFAVQMAKANVTPDDGDTVILYAQWAPTNYKINYKLNGGKLSGTYPKTFTYFEVETNAKKLPTPTRKGYSFQGWYKNSDLKTGKISEIAVGTNENVTVYAKWKKK